MKMKGRRGEKEMGRKRDRENWRSEGSIF